MTTMQLNTDDDDVADSWEDESFSIQLAHTPQKRKSNEEIVEPPSPSHLRIYDASFLLKFRNTPRSEKVVEKIKDAYDLPPQKFEDSPPPPVKVAPPPPVATPVSNLKPVSPAMDLRTVFGNSSSFPTSPSLPTSTFPLQPITSAPAPEPKPAVTSVNRATPPPPVSPSVALPSGPEFQPKPAVDRLAFNSNISNADLARKASNPFRKQPTDSITATTKKLQGILNKLTPEKYERLFQQIVDALFAFKVYDLSDFSSMEVLDNMIGIVFECALAQPGFSCMYADLCRHLCDVTSLASSQAASIGKKIDAKEREEKEKEKEVEYRKYFRQRLLNRCQKEFESAPPKAPEGLSKEEKEEYYKKQRMRASGNVKFVAELFRRKLLTEKIIHAIVSKLLLDNQQQSNSKNKPLPKPDEIELMCTLWNCAGKELDRIEAKDRIDLYFKEMERLQGCHPDPRTRFMLMNACDLRRNQWVDKEKMCIESTPRDTPNFTMPPLTAKPLTIPPTVSSSSSPSPPQAEKEPGFAAPPPQQTATATSQISNWNASAQPSTVNPPQMANPHRMGRSPTSPTNSMAPHNPSPAFGNPMFPNQISPAEFANFQQNQPHLHQQYHQYHQFAHNHPMHPQMGMNQQPIHVLNQQIPYMQARGPHLYGRGYSTPHTHTHQPSGSRADHWKKK